MAPFQAQVLAKFDTPPNSTTSPVDASSATLYANATDGCRGTGVGPVLTGVMRGAGCDGGGRWITETTIPVAAAMAMKAARMTPGRTVISRCCEWPRGQDRARSAACRFDTVSVNQQPLTIGYPRGDFACVG